MAFKIIQRSLKIADDTYGFLTNGVGSAVNGDEGVRGKTYGVDHIKPAGHGMLVDLFAYVIHFGFFGETPEPGPQNLPLKPERFHVFNRRRVVDNDARRLLSKR